MNKGSTSPTLGTVWYPYFRPRSWALGELQVPEGLFERTHPDELEAGGVVGHVPRRKDTARESHLGRLLDPEGRLAGPSHLAREADLAEDGGARWQRPVAEGRGEGRGHPQVGRRLRDLEAADDAHED